MTRGLIRDRENWTIFTGVRDVTDFLREIGIQYPLMASFNSSRDSNIWYIPHVLLILFLQGTNSTSAQICFDDLMRDDQHPADIHHLNVFYVPDFVLGQPGD